MAQNTGLKARVVKNDVSTWSNWHNNFSQPIDLLYDVYNPKSRKANLKGLKATVKTLQSLLRKAIKDNVRLRALGGGWSLSKAAATDGRVVNTKPLDWLFPVSQQSISTEYRGDPKSLLLTQCGASIAQLNIHLESKKGRSLKTSGASNGQTIAGAMSTGTHGSLLDEGGIQDFVVGIHLIVSPNRHVWLERESYPVVSQAFVDKLGAELIQDDVLFNAALVSFGSFGIIHAVMIETVEIFHLKTVHQLLPFDDSLKKAMNQLDFLDLPSYLSNDPPDFFKVVIDPHDYEKVYVKTMHKVPCPDGYKPDYSIAGGMGPGDDVLSFLAAITDTIPALTPFIVSKALPLTLNLVPFPLDDQVVPSDKIQGKTLGETFNYTTTRGSAVGAAIGIEVSQTTRVLDLILKVHEEMGPVPLAVAPRYVKRSDALLGFTKFDTTCVIDLDGVPTQRTTNFLNKLWKTLDAENVDYSFHWGKVNNLNGRRVKNIYGSAVNEWKKSRKELLDEDGLYTFSNEYIEHLGLI